MIGENGGVVGEVGETGSVSRDVAAATSRLAAAGIASPRVDAELLAAYVLGVPRGRLVLATGFTQEQRDRFDRLVTDRARRVPLQHLTGTAPFRHLELAVGPGVFIPRPETELLVEWGLHWLRIAEPGGRTAGGPLKDSPIVVDLCAGSGAIALSIAAEYPGATVYAVENDPEALGWLRRNAAGGPVHVSPADVTDPAALAELAGTVDLVLSNPPYVPEIGSAGLPAEVTRHDPHQAVFGGQDGLDVVRPLIGRAANLLRPGGALAVEHDDTHVLVVPALLRADGRYREVQVHHDLAGRARFSTAVRDHEPDPARWQDSAS